jgi:hypothetical protein
MARMSPGDCFITLLAAAPRIVSFWSEARTQNWHTRDFGVFACGRRQEVATLKKAAMK